MGASGRISKLSSLEVKEILDNAIGKTFVYQISSSDKSKEERDVKSLQKDVPETEFEMSIARERLRQARLSFNLTVAMTAASAITGIASSLAAVALGFTPAGAIAFALPGGLLLGVESLKLAKHAKDKLDKLVEEIEESKHEL